MQDSEWGALYWLEKKLSICYKKKLITMAVIYDVILLGLYVLQVWEFSWIIQLGVVLSAMMFANITHEIFMTASPRHVLATIGSVQTLLKVKCFLACLYNGVVMLVLLLCCFIADSIQKTERTGLNLGEWIFIIIELYMFSVFFVVTEFYFKNIASIMVNVAIIIFFNILTIVDAYNSMAVFWLKAVGIVLGYAAALYMERTITKERIWMGGRT